MIGSLAMFACLASGPQAPAPEFTADLFLVAGNEKPITDLPWLDQATSDDPVKALLQSVTQPLTERETPFMIIDGADCSLFPKNQDPWVKFIYRSYVDYAPKSDAAPPEKLKPETMLGHIYSRPIQKASYVNRAPAPFDGRESENTVVFQDLNSYRNALTQGTPEARKNLERTILVSRDSVEDSKRFLSESKLDFKNVCISARGFARDDSPNFITFPPAGVVAHYKLSRNGDRWSVNLVDYLRAKTR